MTLEDSIHASRVRVLREGSKTENLPIRAPTCPIACPVVRQNQSRPSTRPQRRPRPSTWKITTGPGLVVMSTMAISAALRASVLLVLALAVDGHRS